VSRANAATCITQQVPWLFLASRSSIPFGSVVIQRRYSPNQRTTPSRSAFESPGAGSRTSSARATSTRWIVSMMPMPRPFETPWMACA